MADQRRFSRDPDTPSRQRARALAEADQQLHAALVEARVRAGLTQVDVAEMLGITQAAVSQFERYDNDPKLSTIRRYAHAVGAVVTHTVTDASGDSVLCGEWTIPWESRISTCSYDSAFTVYLSDVSPTIAVPAPESAQGDFTKAA